MENQDIEALLQAAGGGGGTIPLGHSTLDATRGARCGHGEVVFGEGKSPEELVDIVRALVDANGRCLVTRVTAEGRGALRRAFGDAVLVDERSRIAMIGGLPGSLEGAVSIVCAGTSDRAVALEALHTARFLGADAELVSDVGVAGLHRILEVAPRIREANAIVVVAGMEGALPSVVGGLVDRPVIAVPTSVGYGANFGGLSALLGMLNSCASGVTVVNIDNGFGGAYAAVQINRAVCAAASPERT